MNKKAIGDIVLWIVRIIMLVFIVAAINLVKTAALNGALQSYDTEFYVVNSKILYSPTTLAYRSLETGRAYPGIINLGYFNGTILNKSIGSSPPVRLVLSSIDKSIVKEIYNDKERYNILEPLTFAKQYDLLNKTHYVLIKESSGLKPALLNIQVVVSR